MDPLERRIEPTLGGVPVSASTAINFARQLEAIKSDARYARGVTWVSDRVAHLAMVDGFCAVEEKDWPHARDVLTRAALLDPSNPGPQLELGIALTNLHQYDAALATIDRILSSGTDELTVGRALRQRGYVLFEQGALDASRASYEQSLKVDPDNSIALRELESLRGGAADAREFEGARRLRAAAVVGDGGYGPAQKRASWGRESEGEAAVLVPPARHPRILAWKARSRALPPPDRSSRNRMPRKIIT